MLWLIVVAVGFGCGFSSGVCGWICGVGGFVLSFVYRRLDFCGFEFRCCGFAYGCDLVWWLPGFRGLACVLRLCVCLLVLANYVVVVYGGFSVDCLRLFGGSCWVGLCLLWFAC